MAGPSQGVERIVVGVDGSEHSAAALAWAIAMATGMGSEVIAVFAVSAPIYFDSGYGQVAIPVELDQKWRDDMRRELEDDWCKPLRDARVRYRTVMEDGRAASVIDKVANDTDADMVVVGRRGRGGVAELLLGSVSHELVLHCKRPVLVISGPPN
jgi:nucleotide-binding universal stress UspA family protein